MAKKKLPISKHVLYEASVQAPDFDVEFFTTQFERRRDRRPLRLREDFGGTSLTSMLWASQSDDHRAWSVDLHGPTLRWAQKHRFHERVTYIESDVLVSKTPEMDVICALNFSYSVFNEREVLLAYFRKVYADLADDGLFVLDGYGGPASMARGKEKKKIAAGNDYGGNPYPAFTYIWEQGSFNLLNHDTTCHIHFKIQGVKHKKVFTYRWRLWSMAELRDLLYEAGFIEVELHLEGWDDEAEEPDGEMRPRKVYEEMESFIAYVVAAK